MPHMNDPFFSKSVVLICDHNSHGSMGVIINKKLDQEKSNPLSDKEDLNNERVIFFGGPVMVNFTLLLHDEKKLEDSSYKISDNLFLSNNNLPNNKIRISNKKFISGYAGWSKNQLEKEIKNGDWIVQKARNDLIFGTDCEKIWNSAIELLGFNYDDLSINGGSA
jgi:putative transcriptional regulator